MISNKQWSIGVLASILLSLSATADAERGKPAGAVVELFTSQGCYSCPPADELLGETIRRRPEVVALEFHVDYWDQLVYGAAGTWRDPFSSAEYTERQRHYNSLDLQGRAGVYTPQMIVNGAHAMVGTNRDQLHRQLRVAPRLPVDVFVRTAADALEVHLQGPAGNAADIWRADFIETASTPVTHGENHGKYLKNYHIVTSLTHLGKWWGSSPKLAIDAPQPGSGTSCAVLVQEASGEIIGAAYCPES